MGRTFVECNDCLECYDDECCEYVNIYVTNQRFLQKNDSDDECDMCFILCRECMIKYKK